MWCLIDIETNVDRSLLERRWIPASNKTIEIGLHSYQNQLTDVTQDTNQEEEEGNMAAFNFCFSAIKHKMSLKKILVIRICVIEK